MHCHVDRADICLCRSPLRPAHIMIPGRKLSFFYIFFCKIIHHACILCMQGSHAAHLSCLLQNSGKLLIIYHNAFFFINTVTLKGINSIFYKVCEFFQHLVIFHQICNNAVECIIHTGLVFICLFLNVYRLCQMHSFFLLCKIKHCSHTAAGCCSCTGKFAVTGNCSSKRIRHMSMQIDCSWKNILSGHILYLIILHTKILSHFCDLFTLNPYICLKHSG